MANNVLSSPYIDLDLFRWQKEEVDITSQFKGHVGDVDEPIRLRLLWDGLPYDMRGKKIMYGGSDPNAQDHLHTAYPQKVAKQDNLEQGRFTLYFDRYTFKKEGYWDQFYFKVVDGEGDNQKVISTVNVKMYVIGDTALAHIGEDSKGYWQDMVDLVNQFKEKEQQLEDSITQLEQQDADQIDALTKDALDKLKTLRDNCLQQIKDAIAAIDDPKDGLLARYQVLLTMTREIQQTLKQAQFHEKANQYDTIAKMQADDTLMDGDMAIVKGSEFYNDGKGAIYSIRSKRAEDQPDGVHLIALNNNTMAERNDSVVSTGYLADHGIYPNAGRVKVGTAHIELGKDANGFPYVFPEVRGFIGKYGAGLGGAGTTPAGGSEVYDVTVRPVRVSATQIDIYISPEMIKGLMADFAMKQPDANVGGSFAYIYSEIYTLQVEFKGAIVKSFDIDADFPTNFAK